MAEQFVVEAGHRTDAVHGDAVSCPHDGKIGPAGALDLGLVDQAGQAHERETHVDLLVQARAKEIFALGHYWLGSRCKPRQELQRNEILRCIILQITHQLRLKIFHYINDLHIVQGRLTNPQYLVAQKSKPT